MDDPRAHGWEELVVNPVTFDMLRNMNFKPLNKEFCRPQIQSDVNKTEIEDLDNVMISNVSNIEKGNDQTALGLGTTVGKSEEDEDIQKLNMIKQSKQEDTAEQSNDLMHMKFAHLPKYAVDDSVPKSD